VAHKRGAPRPEDAESGHLDTLPERVRDQINGMPELDERANAMILAERGAPGLEERLRRDHQNPHGINEL
jgi:hypothetical protein